MGGLGAPAHRPGKQPVARDRRHSQKPAPNAVFCRISGNQFSTQEKQPFMFCASILPKFCEFNAPSRVACLSPQSQAFSGGSR
jgi:hypothetical protein